MDKSNEFTAHYDQIRSIVQFINSGAERAGFDAKVRFQIELACDEAANNIIEHAYGGNSDAHIAVRYRVEAGAFRISLHDSGTPFAPAMVNPPTTLSDETPIDNVAIGGLGMHMMRRAMDEVDYQFGDDGNTVTMVKWLPPQGVAWYRKLLNGVDLVSVLDRLDADTNSELETLLHALVSAESPKIVVDLSASPYVNSGGLRVLVAAWRTLHRQGGTIVLAGLNGELHEIFSMVGFDKIFHIFESSDAAIAQLSV